MRKMLKKLSILAVLMVVLILAACDEIDTGRVDVEAVWKSYLKESGETELYFLSGDYDGDGATEAYGITGKGDSSGYANNVKIYFVSASGSVSCVKDKAYGNNNTALFGQLRNHETLTSNPENVFLKCGNQKFIIWEIDGGGSSSISVIFGVRNGVSYQPKVSGNYQWFHKETTDTYIGTKSDWSNGYHEYIDYKFSFNAFTGEFEENKT